MLENFAKSSKYLDQTKHNVQTQCKFEFMINFFEGKLNGKILDVGERNPLTELLEQKYNVKIENTEGDLDEDFIIPGNKYDTIIFSHVIEHIFNPLHACLRLKKTMHSKSKMYIALPDRGKLLWSKEHFHEIDSYRFKMLMKRAGLKTINKVRHRVWRPWWNYLLGFRSFLRLIFEYYAVYTIIVVEE